MPMSRVGKAEKNVKAGASVPKGENVVQRRSALGKFSASEIVAGLKALALDPCDPMFSRFRVGPLWNQTLRLRKAVAPSDDKFPTTRKRKLQQFLKDNFKGAPSLASEVVNEQNVPKLSREHSSHASTISCLLNTEASIDSLDEQISLNSFSSENFLTFAEDQFKEKCVSYDIFISDTTANSVPKKDPSLFVDSDESTNSSSPLSASQEVNFLDLGDSDCSAYSSKLDEPSQVCLKKLRRSIRLRNFNGDHLQRMVVPIGPHFQADIPEWNGSFNEESFKINHSDPESLRWLGTQVWPIKGRDAETTSTEVGKGRPDSCCCKFPGSTDCIKCHILKERQQLQSDLGPAFFSWKLDEMGEDVSKSWTLKEQKSFESLAKMYPLSSRKDFFKPALDCFPLKCKKSILSYYYNVYIPGSINGILGRSKSKSSITCSPEDVRTLYLWKRS